MSALTSPSLTLEEFQTRFGGLKPYHEYWSGVPVQKPMPTWLHMCIQRLLADLIEEAGYYAGIELEMRISQDWQPIPDVVGMSEIEEPYPTKPFEIVVEVLSPEDRLTQVLLKCAKYDAIGIKRIFVIDPEHRGAFEWDHVSGIKSVPAFVFGNGKQIEAAELWTRLDAKRAKF